jgi:hypothetical protein
MFGEAVEQANQKEEKNWKEWNTQTGATYP